MFRRIKIRFDQRGLLRRDGRILRALNPGAHWIFGFNFRSARDLKIFEVDKIWLEDADLVGIRAADPFSEEVSYFDLADHERGIVFVDGRFDRILGPGLHAAFSVKHDLRVEIVDAQKARFSHEKFSAIVAGRPLLLDVREVPVGFQGLTFIDGKFAESLAPGRYAFWRAGASYELRYVDLRETLLEITGQEIMTADKVTLRMNMSVNYVVRDPERALTSVEDFSAWLYREAQLALRNAVGARTLDQLLAEKLEVSEALVGDLKRRALAIGVEVCSVGLRDFILPGEMKVLMNRVVEAKKTSEANLIVRREETAAMRSLANTAKILEGNPTLMRIRELETVLKVAERANLKIVLGDGGLTDRVVKLV